MVDKPQNYLGHDQCDTRPTVTFPAAGHHRFLNGSKLYCLVTEARVCEQRAQGCFLKAKRLGIEPATFESHVQRPDHYTGRPHRPWIENSVPGRLKFSICVGRFSDFAQSAIYGGVLPTVAVTICTCHC